MDQVCLGEHAAPSRKPRHTFRPSDILRVGGQRKSEPVHLILEKCSRSGGTFPVHGVGERLSLTDSGKEAGILCSHLYDTSRVRIEHSLSFQKAADTVDLRFLLNPRIQTDCTGIDRCIQNPVAARCLHLPKHVHKILIQFSAMQSVIFVYDVFAFDNSDGNTSISDVDSKSCFSHCFPPKLLLTHS